MTAALRMCSLAAHVLTGQRLPPGPANCQLPIDEPARDSLGRQRVQPQAARESPADLVLHCRSKRLLCVFVCVVLSMCAQGQQRQLRAARGGYKRLLAGHCQASKQASTSEQQQQLLCSLSASALSPTLAQLSDRCR